MLKFATHALVVACITCYPSGIRVGQASDNHLDASEVVVAPWFGQAQVTTSSLAAPNEITISPTRLATGEYFIPTDILSAWTELRKMLPSQIVQSVKRDFAKESASCREPVTPVDSSLREWLRKPWLDATNSPLRRYFELLGLNIQFGADGEDVVGFILCGFFHETAERRYDLFDAYQHLVSAILQRKTPPPPRHPRCPDRAVFAPAEAPRFSPRMPYQTANSSFSVVSVWVARCVEDSTYFFHNFWDGWFYDDRLSAELTDFLRSE